MDLVRLAEEALGIITSRRYTSRSGRRVQIGRPASGTTYYPEDPIFEVRPEGPGHGTIEVTGETTLSALRRLGPGAVALNFASAHRPGGGFLNGARAQEESLARSSTLYETLEGQGFYDFNSRSGGLYTDAMVYSPTVYVFRDDTGALLDEPWEGAFITSPAVNVSSGIRDPGLVQGTMYERARKVMALAYAKGHRRLVLGAWGCGVFGNDPGTIAGIFRAHLQGEYRGAFEAVTFAISGGHALPEFQRVFSAVY